MSSVGVEGISIGRNLFRSIVLGSISFLRYSFLDLWFGSGRYRPCSFFARNDDASSAKLQNLRRER